MATILSTVPSIKPTPSQVPVQVLKAEQDWYEEAASALRDAFSQGDNSMFAFYAMQDISMSCLEH